MDFKVDETFLSISVADMDRATRFYSDALGATTIWASSAWSSLEIAGVRIGLFAVAGHGGDRVGLHFSVNNLEAACAAVSKAGGNLLTPATEVAPGVHVAEVLDTEGNIFSLQLASS